jgi:DnaK suppressor protein
MPKADPASELDAEQLATLEQKLLEVRTALVARRSGQLRARTALLTEVEDEGDAASRAHNEDTLVSLAEAEHLRLAEVEHALAKLDAGTYGVDEESGEPIGFPRLSALPWARRAAHSQEDSERRR